YGVPSADRAASTAARASGVGALSDDPAPAPPRVSAVDAFVRCGSFAPAAGAVGVRVPGPLGAADAGSTGDPVDAGVSVPAVPIATGTRWSIEAVEPVGLVAPAGVGGAGRSTSVDTVDSRMDVGAASSDSSWARRATAAVSGAVAAVCSPVAAGNNRAGPTAADGATVVAAGVRNSA